MSKSTTLTEALKKASTERIEQFIRKGAMGFENRNECFKKHN